MKKFEYITASEKTLEKNRKDYGTYFTKPVSVWEYYDLNQFGDEGWELVSVIQTFENGTTYYFKREKL